MPDLGDAQSFLDLGEAAVDKEFGSVDEVRRVGGKEYCGFGDIVGLADTSQRDV